MIPDPAFNIWEHTRESLFDLYAQRARGEATEMTCHKQAAELLAPHYFPGMTVLDAGCGSGYFYWSLARRGLEVEYYGLDFTAGFIEIGRQNLTAVPPEHLITGSIEDLEGDYDAVFCVNTLFCLPDYRQGLERLCRATRKILVLRTTLADETVIRYETDDYLDKGFRHLKSYFNIWNMKEVIAYIEDQGFTVAHVRDERTGDEPEISAGKLFPYKFLTALRRDE